MHEALTMFCSVSGTHTKVEGQDPLTELSSDLHMWAVCLCAHTHARTHRHTHMHTYTHSKFFSKVLLSTHPSLKVHFHFLPTFPVCSPTCHRGYPQAPLLSDFTRSTDLKTHSYFPYTLHTFFKRAGAIL